VSDVRQLPGDSSTAPSPVAFSGSRDGLTIVPTDIPAGYRLIGEVDMANASLLVEALAAFDRARGPIVLDLSGLTFIDSVGSLALFQHAVALNGDGPLILTDADGIVSRVLLVLGFDALEGVVLRSGATDG